MVEIGKDKKHIGKHDKKNFISTDFHFSLSKTVRFCFAAEQFSLFSKIQISKHHSLTSNIFSHFKPLFYSSMLLHHL